jgi:predicted adenylyl cyclase CyaB
MPTNLELKIKLNQKNVTEKLVKNTKVKYKGLLKQKDIYYKFKNGLLKLRVENSSYCLIKYFRDEKGTRWSDYEILKLEGKNVEKYLAEILNVETVVEKKRKLYLYKNTRIHIDEVKNLGNFLELETVVAKNKKHALLEFEEVVKLLNLDLKKQIKSSYRKLLKK